MEVAGLAVGIAGLMGLFSTCIQSYEIFNLGASHGRDYEVLLTKLKVEKVRLISWGEAVGIYSTTNQQQHCHESLSVPYIHEAVLDILSCIKLTFTDANKLASRYGLVQEIGSDLATNRNFVQTALDRCQRLQGRMKVQQQGVGFVDKTCWSLADKKRFDILVSDLNSFNNSLRDLIQDRKLTMQRLVESGVESLSDIHSLMLVEDATREIHADICQVASVRRVAIENQQLGNDDTRTIRSSAQSAYFSTLSTMSPVGILEPESSNYQRPTIMSSVRSNASAVPGYDGNEHIWKNAFEIAISKLTQSERSQLHLDIMSPSTISSVMDVAQGSWKQRYGQNIRKVNRILQYMDIYSRIVDMGIQHHPEIPALVWAAMRHLIQISLKHQDSVGQFEETLESVAQSLEKCKLYAGILEGVSNVRFCSLQTSFVRATKLETALQEFYVAFLVFHLKAKIYVAAMTTVKYWILPKPFTTALRPYLSDIDEKERNLKELASVATMEQVNVLRQRMEHEV